jgi:hypothetical protein
MASVVDICNMALSRLGCTKITSIDEESTTAKACKIEFEPTRDSILRDYPWNFATKIESLARLNGEKYFGWEYVYSYPKSCLFDRKIFNEATYNSVDKQPYRIISSNINSKLLILCNLDDAFMEYTAKITDTTLFDASFVDAFAWKLAANLAKPLTGNAELAINLMRTYYQVIDKAAVNNASEVYEKPKRKSSLFDSRG